MFLPADLNSLSSHLSILGFPGGWEVCGGKVSPPLLLGFRFEWGLLSSLAPGWAPDQGQQIPTLHTLEAGYFRGGYHSSAKPRESQSWGFAGTEGQHRLFLQALLSWEPISLELMAVLLYMRRTSWDRRQPREKQRKEILWQRYLVKSFEWLDSTVNFSNNVS